MKQKLSFFLTAALLTVGISEFACAKDFAYKKIGGVLNTVPYEGGETVGDVKNKIAKHEGIEASTIRLIYMGKPFLDHIVLEDGSYHSGDPVTLVTRPASPKPTE
jgi:hypothetical protein